MTNLSLTHDRGAPSDVAETLMKPISQEMLNRDVARLAYVAKDGTPRVVPIAFTWNGAEVVMCTTTNAPKLASLRRPEAGVAAPEPGGRPDHRHRGAPTEHPPAPGRSGARRSRRHP